MGWMKDFADNGYTFGHVGAVHKAAMEVRPYRFANELICGRIAQFLLLPIPAFGFTRFAGQEKVDLPRQTLFSELDFDYERESRAFPDPDASVASLPRLCAGILTFDILVANADRGMHHMWCDNLRRPTKLLIYDHDWALFGPQAGEPRLNLLKDALGLGDTPEHNMHPFLRRLPSARLLDEWCTRIYALSHAGMAWFLAEICREAEAYGLTRRESNAAVEFLKYRARNLETIIDANRLAFESVEDWPRGLFR
jgi:hypothetical protein